MRVYEINFITVDKSDLSLCQQTQLNKILNQAFTLLFQRALIDAKQNLDLVVKEPSYSNQAQSLISLLDGGSQEAAVLLLGVFYCCCCLNSGGGEVAIAIQCGGVRMLLNIWNAQEMLLQQRAIWLYRSCVPWLDNSIPGENHYDMPVEKFLPNDCMVILIVNKCMI